MNDKKRKSLWVWIPSLYFTEGLPYAAVMMLSVVMYAKMGISNAAITFWTGLFGLPWVIKPLWSPFVDIFKTKRWWIVIFTVGNPAYPLKNITFSTFGCKSYN